jgi:hypothetical protein
MIHRNRCLLIILTVVLLVGVGDARATAVRGPSSSGSPLTLPPDGTWETGLPHGLLLLTMETSTLTAQLEDGTARVMPAPDLLLGALPARDLAPGDEVLLRAGDRLTVPGPSAIVVRNPGSHPATATLVLGRGAPGTVRL